MPKETFFRLPKEKQDRLIAAARIEFSRADLKDASISQIIKLAEIPRGSFYQYFEDKEDLYFYYFKLLRDGEKDSLELAFKESHGDFFQGIEKYFTVFMAAVLEGPDKEFYRHLFTGLDVHASNRVMPFHPLSKREGTHPPHPSFKKGPGQLLKLVDFSTLKVESEKEFFILFKLVMSLFFASVNDAFTEDEEGHLLTKEEVIRRFHLRLDWLKSGAEKIKGADTYVEND